MRNEDTPLGGAQGHSVHQHLGQELAAADMTSRHAHVPTAQGIATAPAPFVVQANAQRVMPGIDGVVTLPAGVELSDVHAVGRDLVVNLPDGTQMIIVDGAVFVPELVIGNVEVPATNLAALLIDAEPKPAAGLSQSSGGNFAVPVGPLDPGAPLGDLLPPTDFGYTPPQFKEIAPFINNKPSVVIDTPDQPAGAANATASVNEGALPIGSNPASTAETTTGTIVVTSLDNPTSVSINGVDVTGIGQVIHGAYGDLTITNIVDGVISYSYTLGAPTTGDTTHDLFTVVVTDRDGDTANATLDVTIVDDMPTARADTDSIAAGAYGPETGNVITGDGTTSGAPGADTKGADGASVSAISAGSASDSSFDEAGNLVVHGQYGTLTMAADGSYSYVRDPGTGGGVSDVFNYTLTDGDGDTSSATLTISIADQTPTILINPDSEGGGTTVYESGLPVRTGESAGSDAAANSETTAGSITFTPGDSPAVVAINGTPITTVGQTIANATGVLTITSISGSAIGYSYTLLDNTSGDNTSQTFTVTVTDHDGDVATGNLVIHIVDDMPTAVNDSATQATENAPVHVDVFANDTAGADSVNLTTGVAVVGGSLTGTGSLVYNHDGSFTYTPGAGEEGDVTFRYTITDGDGDPSTATVTIHLLPDSIPTVIIAEGSDTSVDEAALNPNGSNAVSTGETATGSLSITTGNDTIGTLFVGGVNVTNGGVVHGTYGDLTITGTPATGYTYSYTLLVASDGDTNQENFGIIVTDSDGDPASTNLVIHIVDDMPTAVNDSATQSPENASVHVDVFANDTAGADGVNLTTGVAVVGGSLTGTGSLVYNNDGSFTYTPSAGEEGDVTFQYTITDHDGDPSTATVTIHLLPDSTPTVIIAEGSDTSVDEAALSFGSNSSSTAETAAGSFNITTGGDTLASLVVGGVNVTGATTGSPIVVHGAYGDLTVTSDGAGHYAYSYTLLVNTSGNTTHDDFHVVATDSDGDPASTDLVISIVDDMPTAAADVDSVTEDGPLVADGNVLTGVGGSDSNPTDGVADVQGADGAAVSAVAFGLISGTLGTALAGAHGNLTLNADGSYHYDLNNADPAVQALGATQSLTETFTYTITDGDGDTSQTTLTITINGTNDAPTISSGAATVSEEGLAGGIADNIGNPTDTTNSASASGTLTVGDIDSPIVTVTLGTPATALTVGGVAVTWVLSNGGHTLIGSAGATTAITITITDAGAYTVTLNHAIDQATGNGENLGSLVIPVTASDGSLSTPATITVTIEDDSPVAHADTNSVNEGSTLNVAASGVLGNDLSGADGYAAGGGVVGVAAGTNTAVALSSGVGTAITTSLGTLTLYGDGHYTYVSNANSVTSNTVDHFVYTIRDADGDTSTVTLDITVNNVTLAGQNVSASVFEAALDLTKDGADLAAGTVTGSNPGSTGETVTGTLSNAFAAANGYTPQTVTDSLGTFTLDASGHYTYTLTSPIIGAQANNGANNEVPVQQFTYTVVDANGNSTTGQISITIVDDVPTARADTDAVAAAFYGSEGGNVITGIGTASGAAGADTLGADGAKVTFIDNSLNAAPGVAVASSGNTAIAGQFGTLNIDANGEYTYVRAAGTPGGGQETFSYTLTDGDGDQSVTTLTINIGNAPISVGGNATVLLDDDTLAGGIAGGIGDTTPDTQNTTGTLSGSGGDGTLVFNLANTGAPAGFTYDTSTPGTLLIIQGGITVVTVTLASNGGYTVVQNAPVMHAAGGNENNQSFTIGYGVHDADTSTATGSFTITVNDDTPVIDVTAGADAGVVLTTYDSATIGAASSTATSSANFGGVFGLTFGAGADGTNTTPTLAYALNTIGGSSGLTQGGATIYLYKVGSTIVGSTSATVGGVLTGNTVFDVSVASSGLVTLTQYSQIDHPIGSDPSATGAPFIDDIASLADGAISLTASSTITDKDGDTATDSATVQIGSNLHFADDGPSAAISVAGLSISHDESAGNQADANDVTGPLIQFSGVANKGDDPDVPGTGPIGYATGAGTVSSTGTVYGADGGTSAFSLNVSSIGVDSGLNTTDGTDIFLYKEGNLIVGRVGGVSGAAAFAVAIDASTGQISMVQYLSIQHPVSTNPDDSVSIASGAIVAVVTATDGDGDTSMASSAIGGLISFQDSAPIMTGASNINIQNSTDVANGGTFAYNLGADGAPTNNNVFTSVTGAATVNGVAVQNYSISETSENATTAIYAFSFDYANGTSTLAHQTGILTFDKAAGTYVVDLLLQPIQGFSVLGTAGAPASAFVNYNADGTTSQGPSNIATVALSSSLFLQFTGAAEPSSGTGANNLYTTQGTPGAFSPTTSLSFNGIELFTQASATVTVSSSAAGVAGNTIQGGEVLDFNLYNTNPLSVTSGAPTANASSMFIQLTGVGTTEDMIIVLKLFDTSTHEYTTLALMVQNGDIIKSNATLTGTPYAGIVLGNTDGLIVIETNDYQNGNSNLVIVGAQVAGSDEGISGSAVDFNGGLGGSGASNFVALQSFATDVSDAPFKISNIGFVTATTTNQTANLTFNATIQDGDGDKITQTIIATVTAAADSSTPIVLLAAVTAVTPVVLDLNGDGVHFLDQSAGVTFDYNGDGVREATAWASKEDGILVRDANHNGTVDSAAEFVFGSATQTDLQALATYDTNHDGQLSAADADFASFAVWQDANSNGVVDAGEMKSLAAAGIASISLSSDGISYTAASGQVEVAGTGSFTTTSGTTGTLADASFAIGTAPATTTTATTTTDPFKLVAANSNVTLVAALAAAGLASEAAAAHSVAAPSEATVATVEQHVEQAVASVSGAADSDGQQSISGETREADETSTTAPAPTHEDVQAANDDHPLAGTSDHGGEASTALLAATDAPAMAAHAATFAVAMIAMPSAAALAAAGLTGGNAQHTGEFAKELVAALHNGGGEGQAHLDALINALPGHADGASPASAAAASQAAAGVPAWDIGHMAAFQAVAAHANLMEAAMLHHDAVQPVAHAG